VLHPADKTNMGPIISESRIPIALVLSLMFSALIGTDRSAGAETRHHASSTPASALAKRVIKLFDFNERPLGNLEPTPMYWQKVTAPGFPHYVNGAIDEAEGKPAPCFRLKLNGGNLGYRFAVPRVSAFPGSDHKIVAYVKTGNLRQARGYLEAFYMDRFGKVLSDTVRYSRVIGPNKAEQPQWRVVEMELPFTNPQGRFIGLGVFLVQQNNLPEQLAPTVKTWRTDIDAQMCVDDLTVLRLPQCRLKLPADKVLYHSGEPIVVQVTVADPLPDDLEARIIIQDLTGEIVKTLNHPVAILPSLNAVLQGKAEPPTLIDRHVGSLLPGAYRVRLQVLADNKVIIARSRRIAVLDKTAPLVNRENQFGLDLRSEANLKAKKITDLVTRSRASWAIVPIWRSDMSRTPGQADYGPGDLLAVKLNRQGVSVIGAYIDTPATLAEKTGLLNPSVWDLFSSDRKIWGPELSLVLSRHADRIEEWVLGRANSVWQVPDGRVSEILPRLRAEFSQFQDQFLLVPVWPAMIDLPQTIPADGYLVQIPRELVAQGYEDYFRSWSHWPGRARFVLPRPELDRFDLPTALTDFAKRIIYTKRCGFDRLAVGPLWEPANHQVGKVKTLEPTADFVVYANLIRRLGGLKYVGDVQLTDHVRGGIFSGHQRAVLVLMEHKGGKLTSSVMLGTNLTAYDLWGRSLPVTMNRTKWAIDYKPITFIEGIQGDLAKFIASVRFEPGSLASRFGTHRLRLVFDNVFAQTISGEARVYPARNWHFDPPGGRFVTGPGRKFALPMKLRYPSNESIGRKLIPVRFDLETRRRVRLSLLVPLNIELSDLKMRVLWFVRNGRLVVTQQVRNTGRDWMDLSSFLIAPDRPRMERHIRRLGPDQMVVKEYDLGPWKDLFGRMIRVGLRQERGPGDRLVNKVIRLE